MQADDELSWNAVSQVAVRRGDGRPEVIPAGDAGVAVGAGSEQRASREEKGQEKERHGTDGGTYRRGHRRRQPPFGTPQAGHPPLPWLRRPGLSGIAIPP